MATVLVADDELDVLEGWRLSLTASGHSVLVVSSAGQALTVLASTEVDVVLADVALAGMSGIELCRHVVGHWPDVPFLLVTGDAKVEMAIEAIRAGAYDYLLEPVAVPALLVSIERAVRHRALQRKITPPRSDAQPAIVGSVLTLREVVRRHIAHVLALTDNNKTSAARVLGIDRKTLYRKLEADGIAGANVDWTD